MFDTYHCDDPKCDCNYMSTVEYDFFTQLDLGNVYYLKEGDEFSYVDFMQNPITGKWQRIPQNWVGLKFSHKDDNTFSRFEIRVARSNSNVKDEVSMEGDYKSRYSRVRSIVGDKSSSSIELYLKFAGIGVDKLTDDEIKNDYKGLTENMGD